MRKIGSLEEFPENKGKKLDIDGVEIALFRIGDEVFAVSNRCPHKRLPLHLIGHERHYSDDLKCDFTPPLRDDEIAPRGIIDCESKDIYCPWHYLKFDLENGHNSLTDKSIATFDIEVRSDNTVWIDL